MVCFLRKVNMFYLHKSLQLLELNTGHQDKGWKLIVIHFKIF